MNEEQVRREALRFKALLARRLARAMRKRGMTQSELARRMRTSRMVVNRLLCPDDPAVTLTTIAKATHALGISAVVVLR